MKRDMERDSRAYESARGDMGFSLFFFSGGDGGARGDKYGSIIDAARFADEHGFRALWVPERHFMEIGALYPNPALLLAALARETSRIGLRAGSVVLPLHDPLSVAEEWSMLDNLSSGRIGIACASGWQPDDFVLAPGAYAGRQKQTLEDAERIRKLWRGETLRRQDGNGRTIDVRIYPTPTQHELPMWLTSAGNVETFVNAGAIGANLLTYVALYDLDGLSERIRAYRNARAAHGHDPASGSVTVWIQANIDEDGERALRDACAGMTRYFRTDARKLFAGLVAHHTSHTVDPNALSDADLETYVSLLVERLSSRGAALFGTPETCAEIVARLHAAGVDEIACQLDFGLSPQQTSTTLRHLATLWHGTPASCRRSAGLQPAPRSTSHLEGGEPPARCRRSMCLDAEKSVSLAGARERCTEGLERSAFYGGLRDAGFHYGPAFQRVLELRRGRGEALARVEVDERSGEISPASLDALVQPLFAALPTVGDGTYVLTGIRSFRRFAPMTRHVYSHAVVHAARDGEVEGTIGIFDPHGKPLAEFRGVTARSVGDEAWARPPLASDVLYSVAWRARERTSGAPRAPGRPQRFVLFADGGGRSAALQAALEGQGHTCLVVEHGTSFTRHGEHRYAIDPHRAEDYDHLCEAVLSSDAVVHLWGTEGHAFDASTTESLRGDFQLGCGSLLRLAQALDRKGAPQKPHLVVVTAGAQAARDGDRVGGGTQACLWGLTRTIALESPDLRASIVDMGERLDPVEAATLAALLATKATGDQIAVRGERIFDARLTRLVSSSPRKAPGPRHDAMYLVTGGLGAIGIHVAEWLVARGARHIALAGRSAPTAEATTRIDRLRERGANVHIVSVDVADPEAVERFVAECGAARPPLGGVVHAAGVLDDRVLARQTDASLERVMAPKVLGAWNLHTATRHLDLDWFISFSSAASVLGSPAQSNYAAANAFLGALAHHRRDMGLPGTAIAWGPWAETGMTASLGSDFEARVAAQGLEPLAPARALDALDAILPSDTPEVTAIGVDWTRFAQAARQAGGVPSLFAECTANVVPEETVRPTAAARQAIVESPRGEWGARLRDHVLEQVAEVLKLAHASRDPDLPLRELGMDSLLAVLVRNRLANTLGVELPMAVFLRDPNAAALASEIEARLDAPHGPDGPEPEHLPTSSENLEHLLATKDQMDDGAVDNLLREMLANGALHDE